MTYDPLMDVDGNGTPPSLLAPRLGGMFARTVIRAVARRDMEVEVVSRDMVGTRAMEVVVAMAGLEGMHRLVCLSFVLGLPWKDHLFFR